MKKDIIPKKFYLKARDYLLDDGLLGVNVLSVEKIKYDKAKMFLQEKTKLFKKEKTDEYFVYEIEYTYYSSNVIRKYKIECKKLDDYIPIRVQKIKEIFEDDPNFTI